MKIKRKETEARERKKKGTREWERRGREAGGWDARCQV